MNAGASAAAMAGATAAAAHAARLRAEEAGAGFLGYGPGWEFKIVRAMTQKFRDREFFQRFLAEEAEAGWQLVEKLDDNRVRLGRKIEMRRGDASRRIDAYRSWVGMGPRAGALIVVAVMVVLVAVLGVMAFLGGP